MAAKYFLSFIGTAVSLLIFWVLDASMNWNAPIWAYFIVGWMGHR